MKLLIDGSIFRWQARGGISALYRRLLPLIPALAPDLEIDLVVQGQLQAQELEVLKAFMRRAPALPADLRPWRFWRHWRRTCDAVAWRWDMRRAVADVYHPAFYRMSNRSWPSFCFAYDMTVERYPESFPAAFVRQMRILKKETFQRCAQVLCISENTRRDVVELLGVDAAKCRVVYLGPTLATADAISELPETTKPFFLFVGDFPAAYKNFDFMLRALASAKLGDYKDFQLLVVSHKIPTAAQLARYHAVIAPERLRFIGDCSDAALTGLYTACAALLYPSRYEGFGLPVLDALCAGAPVACARTSSLPEVGGDVACYFSPDSESEFAAAVRMAVQEGRQSAHVERRQAWAKQFSWQKTAAAFVRAAHETAGA